MSWTLLQGDVLDRLAEIETGTVQCCVTSPPYWGLRDYGVPGQLGLEPTPEEYVNKMVEVFREVWRVLRKDGTLWLNLGDSYAMKFGGGKGRKSGTTKAAVDEIEKPPREIPSGLKPKDLVGIPWRVAFALQADGWYLRSDIIWAKPNPMPESVTDRPTKAHEYIFLLTKAARYFYDAEAVKEESTTGDPRRPYTSKGAKEMDGRKKWHSGEKRNPTDFNTRNRRSVWTVATQPYPEAHFATFPPKLIEPCILAGASPKACEICGAPWERVVSKKILNQEGWGKAKKDHTGNISGPQSTIRNGHGRAGDTVSKTLYWQPTCSCENEGRGRCTVLDPFAGSGTTLWVAEHFGRDSIGIEISPEYCELIRRRMADRQQTIFEKGATP